MTKTWILNIHSIIDIITNSSTEIFTYCGDSSITGAYELLNEVLKVAGSDKRAEDLFDIEFKYEEEIITESFLEAVEDCPEDFDEDIQKILKEKDKILTIESINDRYKKLYEYYLNTVWPYIVEHDLIEQYNQNYNGLDYSTKIKITAKDISKSDMDIFEKFFSLFDQEAMRDG